MMNAHNRIFPSVRLLLPVLLCLCFSNSLPLAGQHFSPVFNTIASYSPNSRPRLFQELQDTLPDFLSSVESGARLSYLDNQFTKLEGQLYSWLGVLEAKYDTQRRECIVFYPEDSIILALPNPSDFLKPLRTPLRDVFTDMKLFPANNAASRQALQTLFWRFLEHIDLPGLHDHASVIRDNPNNLTQVADSILSYLESQVFGETDPVALSDKLNAAFAKLRDESIKALHVAQSELQNVVEKASDYFIAGDIGIAFTTGEGAFGGGIQAGFKLSKVLSLGGYVNVNTSSADATEQPGKGLVGLRGLFSLGRNIQLDALISAYFGNHASHKDFHSGEFGFGISYRCAESVLVGLAGAITVYDRGQPYISAGISLNGVSPYLPWIVVGMSVRDAGEIDPIFRIIQPISGL